MKYLFLFLFTFVFFSNIVAQHLIQIGEGIYRFKAINEEILTLDDVSGSPYKYEEFLDGEIYFISNNQITYCKLNYNAYNDEIDFIKNDTIYTLTNTHEIEKIILNNDVLMNLHYKNSDSISRGFFVEIINDYISLYKKEPIKFIPSIMIDNCNSYLEPPKFQKQIPEFYISISGNSACLIRNKKKLVQFFSENEVVIDFIKKEKIKINSEDDLKKLVKFLNHYKLKNI